MGNATLAYVNFLISKLQNETFGPSLSYSYGESEFDTGGSAAEALHHTKPHDHTNPHNHTTRSGQTSNDSVAVALVTAMRAKLSLVALQESEEAMEDARATYQANLALAQHTRAKGWFTPSPPAPPPPSPPYDITALPPLTSVQQPHLASIAAAVVSASLLLGLTFVLYLWLTARHRNEQLAMEKERMRLEMLMLSHRVDPSTATAPASDSFAGSTERLTERMLTPRRLDGGVELQPSPLPIATTAPGSQRPAKPVGIRSISSAESNSSADSLNSQEVASILAPSHESRAASMTSRVSAALGMRRTCVQQWIADTHWRGRQQLQLLSPIGVANVHVSADTAQTRPDLVQAGPDLVVAFV